MQIYEYSYQLTRIKAYVMPYIDIQQKWDRYHEPRANFIRVTTNKAIRVYTGAVLGDIISNDGPSNYTVFCGITGQRQTC